MTINLTSNSPVCIGGVVSLNASILLGPGSGTCTPNTYTYTWTGPMNYTSSVLSPTFTATNVLQSGVYTLNVTPPNGCGCNGTNTIQVWVNPNPSTSITNNGPVCQGSVLNFNNTVTGGGSMTYSWTGPNSFSSSTQNPTVSTSATNFMSGNYILVANLPSGCSKTANIVSVVVNNTPGSAGLISGLTSVCQNQNSVTYSVPSINYATTYLWTLPNGASGSSNTNSISVNYGTSAVSGTITVKGINNCGNGTSSSLAVNVNQVPSSAGPITGPSIVCQEDNLIQFSVPLINNATTYNWSLPNGAFGLSTTNVINIDFGSSSTSGYLTVNGENVCGVGNSSNYLITVNPKPNQPFISLVGNIIQSNNQTGNQWYDQNGMLNGETSQNYAFTNNGNYYSIITIDGCSSDPSNVISITGLGVNENYNDLIYLSPNPFNDELTINCDSNNFVKYEIFDASGKIIESNSIIGKSTITTKDYNYGIYFINLHSDLDVLTFKVIKN
jgi:hypothetical protein